MKKFISRRKTDDKIIKRIESLAKLGDEGRFNYFILVDDLIKSSQWGEFENILERIYDFKVSRFKSVNEMKTPSWKAILFKQKVDTDLVVDKLMKDFSIFRVGKDFFKETQEDLQFYIGTIEENSFLVKDSFEILQTENEFQKRIGNKRIQLRVTKKDNQTLVLSDWNENLNFSSNYSNLYKEALTLLKDQ